MSSTHRAVRARLGTLLAFVITVSAGDVAVAQQESDAAAAFRREAGQRGLLASDLQGMRVSSSYVDQRTGRGYVYLQQTYQGIDVHNALATVVVYPDGDATVTASKFVPDVSSKVGSTVRGVPAKSGARLRYRVEDDGSLRLVWMSEPTREPGRRPSITWVDAATGELLGTDELWGSFVDDAQAVTPGEPAPPSADESSTGKRAASLTPDAYFVIPFPVESPLHPAGSGTAQSFVLNPAYGTASPYGWHDVDGAPGADYTTTQGNNVYAAIYGGVPVSGGPSLIFADSLNLALEPTAGTNPQAAVVNVFYWLNVLHDITYQYGFDEVAGNFQVNNYFKGGAGSDAIFARVHYAGSCNASATVPVDGTAPEFYIYTCNMSTPARDGAFDDGVLAWQFMYAAAPRLFGGPANVSCLTANEPLAILYGLSDLFYLWATQTAGESGASGRGLGTFLFGQAADGPGIRPKKYSTDMTVNDYTYGDLASLFNAPTRGAILASALWDLNWALIGEIDGIPAGNDGLGGGFGYSSDKYAGSGGNNLALQLLIDAIKLSACNPGFVEFRNSLLIADSNLTGGENACTIWKTFARRGVGYSASSGSTATGDEVEAFDLPPAPVCALPGTAISGKVLLEGPFVPDIGTGAPGMSVDINGDLPLSHPYGGAPWNYPGTVTTDSVPPFAVDWTLLTARTQDSSGWTNLDTTVAFVMADGSLKDLDGVNLPRMDLGGLDSAYIVVAHRNHLDAMTKTPIPILADTITFDLTQAGAAYGLNATKELHTGIWGLFAGDTSKDGQVTTADFNLWLIDTKAAATGYLDSDMDMDGQVTTSDFNAWLANTKAGATSKVP